MTNLVFLLMCVGLLPLSGPVGGLPATTNQVTKRQSFVLIC
jgi:hypothetical protein